MSEAWERFGRLRLALSRWHCKPGELALEVIPAFQAAWARQRQMEQAVIQAAHRQHLAVPEAMLSAIAAPLEATFCQGDFTPQDRQAVVYHHALMECQLVQVAHQAPPLPDADIRQWYQQHQSRFVRPEQRLAHHLLLTVDNDRETQHRLAWQLSQAMRQCHAEFARLAQRYSHCPTALEGGRMGWVGRGLLYPELETTLFALAEGAVSDPVETHLGWHILWCEAIRPPTPLAEADALARARDYLNRQRQQHYQRQWLAGLVA